MFTALCHLLGLSACQSFSECSVLPGRLVKWLPMNIEDMHSGKLCIHKRRQQLGTGGCLWEISTSSPSSHSHTPSINSWLPLPSLPFSTELDTVPRLSWLIFLSKAVASIAAFAMPVSGMALAIAMRAVSSSSTLRTRKPPFTAWSMTRPLETFQSICVASTR